MGLSVLVGSAEFGYTIVVFIYWDTRWSMPSLCPGHPLWTGSLVGVAASVADSGHTVQVGILGARCSRL